MHIPKAPRAFLDHINTVRNYTIYIYKCALIEFDNTP